MSTPRTAADRPAGSAGWAVPAALFALSVIPLTAGTLRLLERLGGPAVMPEDPRFSSFPVVLTLHLFASAAFALLGAFQMSRGLRRRHPAWHRGAGRVAAIAGLAVVATALWVTLVYSPQPGTGDLLYVVRLVVAPAVAAFLVLGFAAIRRRDITAHRAWMIRAYAVGLGAGTQVFTEGFGEVLLGHGDLTGDLLKTAGWVINLAVAEWVIRRPARLRFRRARQLRTARAAAGATS
jgi:uncharacterized membrane protein YozB (DUF420 family)